MTTAQPSATSTYNAQHDNQPNNQPNNQANNQMDTHIRFGGMRTKLIIAFTVVFALVFGVAYYWFYQFSTNNALEQTIGDMQETANGIVSGINVTDFDALVKNLDGDGTTRPTDSLYRAHVKWLAQTKVFEPNAGVYTFIPGPAEDQVTYIGSAGAVLEPPSGVFFKEVGSNGEFLRENSSSPLNLDANLQAIRTGKTAVESTIYTDNFGAFISLYQPFFNDANKLVGVLGLDLDAAYVRTVQQRVLSRLVLAFVVVYAALFALVVVVSIALPRELRRLYRAAQAIAEGRYHEGEDVSKIKSIGWRDEIEALGSVFAEMAAQVYQRENKLKQQVEELRIEIDEVKAQQQVNEIVESDFFDSLTKKAAKIRRRKDDDGQTEA